MFMFFDVSDFDTIMYLTTKNGEDTTTYVGFTTNYPNVLSFDMSLRKGVIPNYTGDKYDSNLSGKVLRNKENNYIIHIEGLSSKSYALHKGYGTTVFCNFLQLVAKLNEKYPIKVIKGELSSSDYSYWGYSIPLYSKANILCNTHSISLSLHSLVDNKYSFEDFLSIYPEYEGETVRFKYYVD